MIVCRDTLDSHTLPSIARGVRNDRVCVHFDLRNITHGWDKAESLGLGAILVKNKADCWIDIRVFRGIGNALELFISIEKC